MLRSFFCKDFLLNKPAKNEDDEQSKKKKKRSCNRGTNRNKQLSCYCFPSIVRSVQCGASQVLPQFVYGLIICFLEPIQRHLNPRICACAPESLD